MSSSKTMWAHKAPLGNGLQPCLGVVGGMPFTEALERVTRGFSIHKPYNAMCPHPWENFQT